MPSQIKGLRRKSIKREKVTTESGISVDVQVRASQNIAGSASFTLDDTKVPTGSTGILSDILNWFSNRIKAITGKANWYTAPARTLEQCVDTAGLTTDTIPVATGANTIGSSRISLNATNDDVFSAVLIPYLPGDESTSLGYTVAVGDSADTDNDCTALHGASYSGEGVSGLSTNGNAVQGQVSGSGHAGYFLQTGTGKGMQAVISNTSNTNHAVEAATDGSGNAVKGVSTGASVVGFFESQSASPSGAVVHASATASGHDEPLYKGGTAGTGNLLQLQQGGTDKFVVDNSGYITVGGIDSPFLAEDHFVSGTTTSGSIGSLGWMWTAGTGGTIGAQSAEANHPGLLRLSTGTISGVTCVLYGRTVGSTGAYHTDDLFDSTWVVRLNTNDSNTHVRIGLGYTTSNTAPNSGIYIEKLPGDASWYGVTRSGGTQTRTAALAACSTGWIKFRIRRVDASTIGFTVDGGSEVTATTNIPSTASGIVACLTLYNATSADKTLDVDYFRMKLPKVT